MSSGAVCAVVVTHNPGERFAGVLESFRSQVDHTVIVDNASDAALREWIKDLAGQDGGGTTLILNSTNRWLAAALNQGTAWASAHAFEYVLLMNDGNMLSPRAVAAMLRPFHEHRLAPVGSVNARVIMGSEPIEFPPAPIVEERLPVTAGCLIPVSVVERVGGQREEFLIDMIDFDFGLRLKRHGYRTLQVPSVTVACELGRTTRRRFLWRHCNVENYSPIRRYYFARNGLALLRETRDGHLARFYLRFLVSSLAKVLIFEDERRSKLMMSARGILDGLRGKLGEIESV